MPVRHVARESLGTSVRAPGGPWEPITTGDPVTGALKDISNANAGITSRPLEWFNDNIKCRQCRRTISVDRGAVSELARSAQRKRKTRIWI